MTDRVAKENRFRVAIREFYIFVVVFENCTEIIRKCEQNFKYFTLWNEIIFFTEEPLEMLVSFVFNTLAEHVLVRSVMHHFRPFNLIFHKQWFRGKFNTFR